MKYKCDKCGDLGVVIRVDEDGYTYATVCECLKARKSLQRLERSGLSNLLDKYTFDRYTTKYAFQKDLLDKAKRFVEDTRHWFVIVGESGIGKSHICTAICGELLKRGKEVRFMSWLTDSVKLKQNINNYEIYEPLIRDYKTCEVLYVDDLFKSDNNTPPTPADIKLAMEIFNYRYNNKLKTLVSGERLIKQLMEYDTAIVGRLVEMSEGYLTEIVGREKNYRLRNWL